MTDFGLDQAAGLRRIFRSRQLRAVTFASATEGVGKTTLLANVAVELARQGQNVLAVDENCAHNLSAFFNMRAKSDLTHILNRKETLEGTLDKALEDALFSPVSGLRVLSVGKMARQFARLSAAERDLLHKGIQTLARPVDTLLIDSASDHAAGFSPWGLAGEVVMIVSGARDSITEAYALIRKISASSSRRHFRILANRVHEHEGQTIFGNLKKVAAQRGVARLEYGGAIPLDNTLKQLGQLCQPVVEALPDNPAALALRKFAARLCDWSDAEDEHGGVEQFVAQLLHSVSLETPRVLHA